MPPNVTDSIVMDTIESQVDEIQDKEFKRISLVNKIKDFINSLKKNTHSKCSRTKKSIQDIKGIVTLQAQTCDLIACVN